MLVVIGSMSTAQVVEVKTDRFFFRGPAFVLQYGMVTGQRRVLQLDVVGCNIIFKNIKQLLEHQTNFKLLC